MADARRSCKAARVAYTARERDGGLLARYLIGNPTEELEYRVRAVTLVRAVTFI